ncbi:Chaperone protein DnaK [Polystyrenella longa]|uniref:Chaperone protein DnaK n=1 Tax=Polystyrenella longa TaxID=2528007 RepID=A0A518CLV4_9PLAN|nr:Hsp70 family protein [Polystyrenella longa]QDU80216.1 Chaperone protein DnaK [Polystyrenella longa]
MNQIPSSPKRHAVGIDFGTTYSSISCLNRHGQPITIPNEYGEPSTPSALLFEPGQEIVIGRRALERAIEQPEKVILYPKREIGKPNKKWYLNGETYTPVDLAALIIRKLLNHAERKVGRIRTAVITVPAQFSEVQRQEVVAAGHKAGLKTVDIINEPVAAALCHVLGTEGLWFTELTETQRILVFDLGGGTFDLSIVHYSPNEVQVIGGGGHLHLGGLDWSHKLEEYLCRKFSQRFQQPVAQDPHFLQQLVTETEQVKRTLSQKPEVEVTCEFNKERDTLKIQRKVFEELCEPLVEETRQITLDLLKKHNMGWAHIDAVLLVGGASRMPMIRRSMKKLSGRTLNSSLSPDHSIAHGAAYFAGMLSSNDGFARSILEEPAQQRLARMSQRSVNSRGLGIMVRTQENANRVPHYLIPTNTPLPAQVSQVFETVRPNQSMIKIPIIESGTQTDTSLVHLGDCRVENLPPNLPEGTEVLVTMKYDHAAMLEVSAKVLEGSTSSRMKITRSKNIVQQLEFDDKILPQRRPKSDSDLRQSPPLINEIQEAKAQKVESFPQKKWQPQTKKTRSKPIGKANTLTMAIIAAEKAVKEDQQVPSSIIKLASSAIPIPLCEDCMEPFDNEGNCSKCRNPMVQAKEFEIPKAVQQQQARFNQKKRHQKPTATRRPKK